LGPALDHDPPTNCFPPSVAGMIGKSITIPNLLIDTGSH
jgi:hypothetical protein